MYVFIIPAAVFKAAGDYFPILFWYSSPHVHIASKIGFKLYPTSVSEYSTFGGTSAYTFRFTSPLCSICRSCAVNTFCETCPIDFFNSPNRFVPGSKSLKIKTFHLSLIKVSVVSTGQAKITSAYNLPCRYVLHTVGPIINGHLTKKDCDLLAGCYTSCLQLATDYHLESVAFCCISTGVFHFPNEKAAEIAIASTTDFLKQNDTTVKKVIFNVFKENDKEIYERLLGSN